MAPIAHTSGFQKELIYLRILQGKMPRKNVDLESTLDLGHGNLFLRKPNRLEPKQGQIKVNTGPRVPGTNDKGPNKGWVPKFV